MPDHLNSPELPLNRLNAAFIDLSDERLAILAGELLTLESEGAHPQNDVREMARTLEDHVGIPFSVAFDLVKRRVPMEITARWVKAKAEESAGKVGRALIVVDGGVADYASDEDVHVVVFDRDNFNDDPDGTDRVPKSHADLAAVFDVPVDID